VRVWAGQEERSGSGKRTAQYARRLLAANAVNKTNKYQITSDTTKNVKIICNIFGSPGPDKLYRLPLSSRRYCAVESSTVVYCGWEVLDGKQRLRVPQPCALLESLADIFSWTLDFTTHTLLPHK
jgi:hypothetical protein